MVLIFTMGICSVSPGRGGLPGLIGHSVSAPPAIRRHSRAVAYPPFLSRHQLTLLGRCHLGVHLLTQRNLKQSGEKQSKKGGRQSVLCCSSLDRVENGKQAMWQRGGESIGVLTRCQPDESINRPASFVVAETCNSRVVLHFLGFSFCHGARGEPVDDHFSGKKTNNCHWWVLIVKDFRPEKMKEIWSFLVWLAEHNK